MPTPAAESEHTMTLTSGSFVNPSIASWRAFGLWSPRMLTERMPTEAKCRSAASMTSMCLAKNTTLPTLRASCAV